MSFRLVPKSVTLNDLERRNGVILRCFSEFGYLPGALRKSSRSLSHLLMSSSYVAVNVVCVSCASAFAAVSLCAQVWHYFFISRNWEKCSCL